MASRVHATQSGGVTPRAARSRHAGPPPSPERHVRRPGSLWSRPRIMLRRTARSRYAGGRIQMTPLCTGRRQQSLLTHVTTESGGSRVIPCWRLVTACSNSPRRCLDRRARQLHPRPGAYMRSCDRRGYRDAMPCAEPSARGHQPNVPDLARPGHRSQPPGPHRGGAPAHNRAGSSTMTGIWRVVLRS